MFREVFRSFREVFQSFREFLEIFGSVRTQLYPFGPIGMHSEAIGSGWTFSIFFLGFLSRFSTFQYVIFRKLFFTAQ